jgi:hypothetical protein
MSLVTIYIPIWLWGPTRQLTSEGHEVARIEYQTLYYGEAKAVVIEMKQYEQMQETMAMLEIIAQGKQDSADCVI